MKPNVSNIKSTKNYGLFRPHGQQPIMNLRHVAKIEASMREHGFIQAKPIHCYMKNGVLYIIDGHNRLKAAENLGIAVYYVIGDESQAGLIAPENIAVRKWGTAEFVNMYAIQGNKDYVLLTKYVKRGVPINQAASMLWGQDASSGNAADSLQNGTFRVKTTTRIDSVIYTIEELSHVSDVVRTRVFIASLSALLFVDAFELDKLISKIKQNPQMLVRSATREQMLCQLEDIYNFRTRDKVPIAFLTNEELRNRKNTILGRVSK